jgi:hypothetical protein
VLVKVFCCYGYFFLVFSSRDPQFSDPRFLLEAEIYLRKFAKLFSRSLLDFNILCLSLLDFNILCLVCENSDFSSQGEPFLMLYLFQFEYEILILHTEAK